MAFWNKNKKKAVEESSNDRLDKIKQGKLELDDIVSIISKEKNSDLSALKCRVAVCMDHSGSMRYRYDSGEVQQVLDLILPFGLKFDDNGSIEVFIFDDICRKMDEDMNLKNYTDYVENYIIKPRIPYGGTHYAPAIEGIDKFYDDGANIPTIVFFITDGENFYEDRTPCDAAIIDSSEHSIFFMTIGVGNDEFDYLRHLDDLKERPYDNTGFMKFDDFKNITTVNMFTNALKDFVPWLKAKKFVR